MNVEMRWNGGSEILNLPEKENDFYYGIAEELQKLDAPNTVYVNCPLGNIEYMLIKRGKTFFIRENSNSVYIKNPGNYKKCYLTCVDPVDNHYKYYQLEYDTSTGKVIATYGRIGASDGDVFGKKTYIYNSSMYYIKYLEKIKKGYIDKTNIFCKKPKKKEKTIINDVKTNNASIELFASLKSFSKNYVTANIKQNVNSITEGQIKETKRLMKQLYQRKTVNGFNNKLLEILAVSPRKVDDVKTLLATDKTSFSSIIQREEDLLNAMESLIVDTNIVSKKECFENLGIEVYYANDKQKKEVLGKLDANLQGKVKNIYRIINKKHKDRFNNYLKNNNIKKVKQYWHGSRNENWFSIINAGLLLNPNAIITGKMFGNGIYFAPSCEKSWKYTSYRGSYWARGNSDTAFMGLYATAYGNPYDCNCAHHYTEAEIKLKNCNCVHAHAGPQLMNDEVIFYNESAILLNYIVEFK